MQPWDYLVFIPVMGAGLYLWQRRRKKSSCGGCSACPGTKGCGTQASSPRPRT